jgi:hypothetical protein
MLINIVGFNCCWVGLVLMGNSFIPVALAFLFWHLFFYSKIQRESLLIFMISCVGISVDSTLHWLDFFEFSSNEHIPYWLMVLWGCFATTISHSLQFLSSSKLLQFIIGGLFAPLSYIGGYKLMAVEFSHPIFVTYIMLSLIWSLLLPLIFYLKNYTTQSESYHV